MENRIRFVRHRGKLILLIDISHCKPREILTLADEVQRQIAKHPHNSVLTLTDFTGAQFDKVVATRVKELLVLDRPYIKRSAWVGTESLPKVYYENFKSFSQRDLPTFKTREEAMDWLAQDAA
jgi:hypothetical protein